MRGRTVMVEALLRMRHRTVIRWSRTSLACAFALLGTLAGGSLSEGQTKPQALGPTGAYRPIDKNGYDQILGILFPQIPAITKGTLFAPGSGICLHSNRSLGY